MGSLIERKKRILLNEPHQNTATGSRVHIETDMIAPLVISGNGNITICGKNIFDGVYPHTTQTVAYRSIYVGDDVVTASTDCPLVLNQYANLFIMAGVETSGANTSTNGLYIGKTRTVTPVNGYITIASRNWEGVNPSNSKTMIETGVQATDYEEYIGTTSTATTGRKSIRGINNIWSDSGSITVKYWAHADIIPSGYQRCEFISSTGAYINTGRTITNGSKVTITFAVGSSTSEQAIWGVRHDGAWSDPYQLYIRTSNQNRNVIIGKGATASQYGNATVFDYDAKTTVVLDSKNNRIIINGSVPSGLYWDFTNGTAFNSSGSSVYNPFLFAFNNKGTVTVASKTISVYDYKVEKDGQTLQHLIPAKRISDNVYGMYDVVSNQFFTSANSSTFTGQ